MSISVTSIPILLLSEIVPDALGAVKYNKVADIHTQKFQKIKFETIIVDKETLLKTLIEHSATNIVDKNNHVYCDCEGYYLDFYKQGNKAYQLTISCFEKDRLKNFVENISAEYTTNSQEVSYNKIKERLEEEHLTIDEEEIYDDNTIVLTINLE